MVAAVCVIIPHTQQSHFARGSLDVMGRVCIALGEVHTWAALPFPAFESLHAEPHATQAGARATQPGTVLCPTPLETNPKTSLSPMGTTDSLPSAVQAALQGNRRQGTHSGEPSWRPGHPQTHTRPPHCITTSSAGPCYGSSATSHRPSWGSVRITASQEGMQNCPKLCPSGMMVFLTVTGKEQSGLLAALPFQVLTAHTQHSQGWLPQSLFSIFKWL